MNMHKYKHSFPETVAAEMKVNYEGERFNLELKHFGCLLISLSSCFCSLQSSKAFKVHA